ncbi:MAG: hypothetical protein LBL91_03500 [Lachnospiraceae bacterium]|jgi:hypothetical protein|nr:hypothetical protein [Lachnospiraceae bacterium]
MNSDDNFLLAINAIVSSRELLVKSRDGELEDIVNTKVSLNNVAEMISTVTKGFYRVETDDFITGQSSAGQGD